MVLKDGGCGGQKPRYKIPYREMKKNKPLSDFFELDFFELQDEDQEEPK